MNQKHVLTTKKLVLTALMAALTVAGSALRITMPVSIGGNTAFHLGNILCALCGLLLGPWLGGLAAGLGSAIYDMLNPLYGLADCWITFLTKAVYGLAAGLVGLSLCKKLPPVWQGLLGTIAGAIGYALLYLGKTYFYSGLLVKGLTAEAAWITVIEKLPSTIFNGVVAIIGATILYPALRLALERNRLLPNSGSSR